MLSQAEEDIVKARQEGARQKDLEAKLAKAVSEARALGRAADAEERPSASGGSGEVVLYTTAWCGVCKRAKAWLKSKRIDFVEKDVEKDADASQELAQKCAKAGVRANGVPVLDARGKLLVGFDAGSYQSALR